MTLDEILCRLREELKVVSEAIDAVERLQGFYSPTSHPARKARRQQADGVEDKTAAEIDFTGRDRT